MNILISWMFRGPTVAQRLREHKEHTRGFDYLRFVLAFTVLCWHGVKAVYGPDRERVILGSSWHGVICLILPMFFALSGFLVCGSLDRTRALVPFVAHRLLRIIPALAVEIALSALVLGPVLTQLPLKQYFLDPQFFQYFLNIVGLIHFRLPGLFLDNPEPFTVNASLWTIPYELECYVALVALAFTGLLRRTWLLLAAVLLAWPAFTAVVLWRGAAADMMQSGPPGRLLVVCFLAGNLVYLARARLPLSPAMLAASIVLSFCLLSRPETTFLAPLPVAYMTAYLGLFNPPKIPVLMDGDYSYGLYLFAFPIQQTCSAFFPGERSWLLNVLVAATLSLGYAFLSWHLIEKPVLARRKWIIAWTQATLGSLHSLLRPAKLVEAPKPANDKPSAY